MTIEYKGDGKPIALESRVYLTDNLLKLSELTGEVRDPSPVALSFSRGPSPFFDVVLEGLEKKLTIPGRDDSDYRVLSSYNHHCAFQVWTRRDVREGPKDGLVSNIYLISYEIPLSEVNKEKVYAQEDDGMVVAEVKKKDDKGPQKVRFILEYTDIKGYADVLGEIRQGADKIKAAYELVNPPKGD